MRGVSLIFMLLSGMAEASIPDVLARKILASTDEVREAVLSNSHLMDDFGVRDAAGLSEAKLDVERAFPMKRLALERVANTTSIRALIDDTPYYYVPYCIATRCPGLAAFVYAPDHEYVDFVSIGEAGLARALVETKERQRERGIDAAAPLVFVAGPQTPLVYFRDPQSGDEQLLFGTAQAAQDALRWILDEQDISPADREMARLDTIDRTQLVAYAKGITGAAAASEEEYASRLPVSAAQESAEAGRPAESVESRAADLQPLVRVSATYEPPASEESNSYARVFSWLTVVSIGVVAAAFVWRRRSAR